MSTLCTHSKLYVLPIRFATNSLVLGKAQSGGVQENRLPLRVGASSLLPAVGLRLTPSLPLMATSDPDHPCFPLHTSQLSRPRLRLQPLGCSQRLDSRPLPCGSGFRRCGDSLGRVGEYPHPASVTAAPCSAGLAKQGWSGYARRLLSDRCR